jgi:hypothetical protein
MSDLSPESRALLRGAREELEAGDAERARVGRALAVRLGVAVGTVVGTATTASASVAPGALSAGVGGSGAGAGAGAGTSVILAGTKWLGAALLVGAVGVAGVSVVRAKHGAPPSAVVARAAPAAAASPIREAPAPTLVPSAAVEAPRAAARDQSGARVWQPRPEALPPPPAISATVGLEARLLRSADEALRDGDATRALALLREHARAYPNGVLAEERGVVLVSTLCRLGRVAEAREEAARFLRTTPESPLAASVRSSCGGGHAGEAR